MSSPAHPILMVNGKQTWLAVLNGGLNPTVVLYRGRITEIEEKMGRWRDAGRIVAGTVR